MTKISVKNLNGEKVKDLTLTDSVWNIEVNTDSLKKMIRLQLDASRQGTRKTKNRSEVSGGGRSLGDKKVLDVLVKVVFVLHNGVVAEYLWVLVQEIIHSKLIRKKELLL